MGFGNKLNLLHPDELQRRSSTATWASFMASTKIHFTNLYIWGSGISYIHSQSHYQRFPSSLPFAYYCVSLGFTSHYSSVSKSEHFLHFYQFSSNQCILVYIWSQRFCSAFKKAKSYQISWTLQLSLARNFTLTWMLCFYGKFPVLWIAVQPGSLKFWVWVTYPCRKTNMLPKWYFILLNHPQTYFEAGNRKKPQFNHKERYPES